MTLDPRLPVIVGVGQVTWRAAGLDDALSPVELMTARLAPPSTMRGSVP
ncbi:MAG: hypothetical protein R2705_12555 [Ilumatobacteraceae bacterium]